MGIRVPGGRDNGVANSQRPLGVGPGMGGGDMTAATRRDIPEDSLDDYAREYACLPAHAFTGYTHAEAATVPRCDRLARLEPTRTQYIRRFGRRSHSLHSHAAVRTRHVRCDLAKPEGSRCQRVSAHLGGRRQEEVAAGQSPRATCELRAIKAASVFATRVREN